MPTKERVRPVDAVIRSEVNLDREIQVIVYDRDAFVLLPVTSENINGGAHIFGRKSENSVQACFCELNHDD